MAAQTVNYPPVYKVPQFAFLANPPPPTQKKRPTPTAPLPAPPGPLPSPPVPASFSTIVTWAAHVQPGSPAPRSPQRRPSITSNSSRRPSISRLNRRSSISHGRAPSGSFIHIIDTPTRTHATTPVAADFDLTALGYTSVFVHLPKTPTTPSPYLRLYHQQRSGATADSPKEPVPSGPLSASAFAHIPIPPIPSSQDVGVAPSKRKGMKRFRSLSILRPRASKAKSQAAPPSPALISPTKTALTSKSTKVTKPRSKESKAKVNTTTVAERKRAKYTNVRPPPPLANELAMMQFTDGGSMESHVKRVMEAQAKAAAGSGATMGVADVYRDGKGGLWWDQDEELEYEHLLGGSDVVMKHGRAGGDVDEMDWEEFDDTNGAEPLAPFLIHQQPQTAHASEDKENDISRRSSISTQDSDLDPTYLLPLPENEDPRNVALEDRVLASRSIGGAGMSILSLPSRPRRAAKHLCKPTFLVDVAAFGPRSPTAAATSKRSPLSPTSGSKSSSSTTTTTTKPRGKARRRPAPLKLATSNSNAAVVVRRLSHTRSRTRSNSGSGAVSAAQPVPTLPPVPVASPGVVERTRREFIENSFNPTPAPAAHAAPSVPVERTRAAKPSRLGMRGFFTLARRGE